MPSTSLSSDGAIKKQQSARQLKVYTSRMMMRTINSTGKVEVSALNSSVLISLILTASSLVFDWRDCPFCSPVNAGWVCGASFGEDYVLGRGRGVPVGRHPRAQVLDPPLLVPLVRVRYKRG